MEIILMIIYLLCWLLINGIMYKSGILTTIPPLSGIGNLSPEDASEIAPSIRLRQTLFGLISGNTARELIRLSWRVIPSNKILILFQILFFIAFLLLVFLGPHIQSLNEAEEKARKRYEKIEDEIFKQPWLDAISNRNRYYLYAFLTFGFLPFFYLLWFVYSSSNILVLNKLISFDVFILEITAGFEGFVIYLYTLFSQKPWYFYSVPLVYLFTFMKAENNSLKNYFISALLMIWTFLYFYKTSILWSIPFFVLIPLLFMT